jgi:hypothetical protein
MSVDPILTPENKFPLGQRIALPGHFLEPVTLEGIRFIGSGYECRVRLSDGTPDEAILNRRLAYVAVSRGRHDAQVYTNDKTSLAEGLGRDVSHRSAIEPSRESTPLAQKIEPPSVQSQVHENTQAVGHSISR